MNRSVAYKFIVQGRVQGVGFRWFVLNAAQELKVTGSVKNVYNGNVEIFAQSDINTIQKFKLKVKEGPALSRVDSILEIKEEFDPKLNEFKVIV